MKKKEELYSLPCCIRKQQVDYLVVTDGRNQNYPCQGRGFLLDCVRKITTQKTESKRIEVSIT